MASNHPRCENCKNWRSNELCNYFLANHDVVIFTDKDFYCLGYLKIEPLADCTGREAEG